METLKKLTSACTVKTERLYNHCHVHLSLDQAVEILSKSNDVVIKIIADKYYFISYDENNRLLNIIRYDELRNDIRVITGS